MTTDDCDELFYMVVVHRGKEVKIAHENDTPTLSAPL